MSSNKLRMFMTRRDGAAPLAEQPRLPAGEDADPSLPRLLVDSRTPERYRGIGETLDKTGGHIPGAANYFFQQNLTDDKTFKSPAMLKAQWAPILQGRDPKDVVVYCGSGVTACHNLLALEHAGIHGVKVFPGSWSEWSSDSSRPVATTED